jgi:hypothetical protein
MPKVIHSCLQILLDMENGVTCNIILKFNFFGFVVFFHLKIH